MVDIEKITGTIGITPTNAEQYLSNELRVSIQTLHQQLTDRVKNFNVDDMNQAAELAERIPTIELIGGLVGVNESLSIAKIDRIFIANLLQVYARVAEELDNKIMAAINELGDHAPLVFDRLTDGGYGTFSRFGWYFYEGASELKKNKHTRYLNFWISCIRYSHLAVALLFGLILGVNYLQNKLPFIDAELSIFAKLLFGSVFTWNVMISYIPEFVYPTFSNNFISRWIRRLFTGAATNIPEDQIQAKLDSFLEIRKNILSVRMQLRANLRKMLKLAKNGEFKTHYWSVITFDEMTDALTRGNQLTYKDRNILLILLGISQTLPLISNPDFMIGIAPLVWRRYGYGLVAAFIANLAANVFLFEYLKSIPLAKILL